MITERQKTIFFLAVSTGIVGTFLFFMRNYSLEDALIYYRYLRNAINGHGLVYNLGEHFNALTSPLYTYISLVVSYIFRNIFTSQLILSGVFLLMTAWGLLVLLREHIKTNILYAAPLLLVTNYYFYLTFGMETTLFMFLLVMTLYFYEKANYFALGIVSALMLLARGESALLLLILTVFHFAERRPFPKWTNFIIPAAILIAHYSFNYFYYGDVLPETLSAKINHGKSGFMGAWPVYLSHKKNFIHLFFGTNYFLLLVLGFLGGLGLLYERKTRLVLITTVYFVVYNSFYIAFNIPNYFWYYSYNFLYMVIMVTFGLKHLPGLITKLAGEKGKAISGLAAAVVFLFVLIAQGWLVSSRVGTMGGMQSYIDMSAWIRENTPPDARIAAAEIGHIGWYTDRYIIDMLGLVNPKTADYIGKKQFDYWLKYKPDYFVVHDPMWLPEQAVQKLLEEKKVEPVARMHGLILYKRISSVDQSSAEDPS